MEQQYLQGLREEIVENLRKPGRESGELLNEIWDIDRELAGTALFVMGREEYHAPEVVETHDDTDTEQAHLLQDTLF